MELLYLEHAIGRHQRDHPSSFLGSAWLVTFSEGQDPEPFEINTAGMGGTSPFALVEEVT